MLFMETSFTLEPLAKRVYLERGLELAWETEFSPAEAE